MAQSIISVRMDAQDKKEFEVFCSETGMNPSVAINMFVKRVIRDQKLPFTVSADPFYSKKNMDRLQKAVDDLNAGKGKVHEVDYENLAG